MSSAVEAKRASKRLEKIEQPSAAALVSPEKRTLILSLLLAAITLILYNQANSFSFLNFDDDMYVTENPHIRAGLDLNTLKWAMTSMEGNWHPVTWISHAFDYQMFHLNPTGHHLTNILLHTINAVLLFLLLLWATRRTGASFVIAALFAVHPLNVESVAWIAERKNLLSTTFFLLTIGAYGWYSQKPGWKRYSAVFLFFALGLASKSMLVTLPFVLLLLDYWPLGRIRNWSTASRPDVRQAPFGQLFLEKVPLLALSAADSIVTVIAQRQGGAVGSTLRFPLLSRLENAIYSYADYIWKMFWPARLAPLYPHPANLLPASKAILAVLFLALVSSLVWKFRSRQYLLVGWLFFLGTLVPVIGLVQVGSQAMADRYVYIPCMGIFIMVVLGAADLANHYRFSKTALIVASACVLLALSIVTYRQTGFWKNSFQLWSHALAVTNDNFAAEDGLGGALVQQGRSEEAYPHFQRAAALVPDDPISHAGMGVYLHQHGDFPGAIREYEIMVHLNSLPHLRAFIYANLGSAYRQSGDFEKAQESFADALQIDASVPNAWTGMGDLAMDKREFDHAVQDYLHAVELRPTAETYIHLARALNGAGRSAEAELAYAQAEKLQSHSEQAAQTAGTSPQESH